MNDNKMLVEHRRGVYNFMGMFGAHLSWFFCYHAFFKKFQILANSNTFVHLKPSLGLHWVYDNKAHTFLIWGIFCGSCSQ